MSARLLELMDLAEECPQLSELRPFLTDADPEVRRTALSVLSETTEEWAQSSPLVAAALSDPDVSVRHAAIGLLTELLEVLVAGTEFDAALRAAATAQEPAVRAAAIEALWRHRRTDATELSGWFADANAAVRRTVVAGLTSVDALVELDAAAADPAPNVRIAVAKGIAAVGDPRGAATLIRLAGDTDPLVRAAGLTALAQTGCGDDAAAVAAAAMDDPAWQVRQGAAIALAVADPEFAAPRLISAVTDGNLDVRKAAVRGLAERIAERPEVTAALRTALEDPDADVRAFARIGIANSGKEL
ncbi:HEAT repeat [Nocardia amikacinitolerans]|uniref:HEAT repeat n=1 Tax=Nocardia amikacinitolerans TaxID=756689 RepID=A0A285LVB5_9NOCA|nr:HEAT repeat [Nocardia amikacinitolerans]SNY88805.1 HEAT repeat [Nocardia amikacinitolerans]